nr:hypothetical protein [Salinispora arenicola]
MFGWPEVRLRHTESYVYTHLGHTQRALAAQDRALELYPADLGRERAPDADVPSVMPHSGRAYR